MKIRIRKKSGKREKFKKSKLISSLQKAGLETRKAKAVVASIKIEDGMTTGEIKYQVHRMLEKINRTISKRYWTTTGMKARVEPLEVDGVAIISSESMTELDLQVGDQIDIFNGEKYEKVRAYPLDGYGIEQGSLLISHHDMSDIGVHPGSRVAVRKHEGMT